MSWDDGTGGKSLFSHDVATQIPLSHGSVSGDRWAPDIETIGNRATGTGSRRSSSPSGAKFSTSRQIPTEKALQKRRLYLKACLDELERVQNSDDDPICKGNSLAEVQKHLQALWELVEGNPASESLEEMINTLQVAFCVESPNDLERSQVDTLWSVFFKMYEDPDIDDLIANDLTQELIKGGIDVFREIE